MLSLKIAATGLAAAALAWLALQTCNTKSPLFLQAMLGVSIAASLVTAIVAGLFAIWY